MKLRVLTTVVAGCLVGLLTAACGQTGPLHLSADAPAKEGYLLKKRTAKPAAETAPVTPALAPEPAAPASP